MPDDSHRDARTRDHLIALAVALIGVAWGVASALGVGDDDASGIVEDGLGGAGTGLVLALFFIGVPALVVGTLDGLTARLARPVARLALRVLLVGGLGFWAGLWIFAFSDIDCDGTCIDPDRGLVWTTLAVTVASFALEWLVAWAVGGRAQRRGNDRHAAETSS